MTRRKEYTTAVARRRQDPIMWVIDGVEFALRPNVEFADLEEMMNIARDAQGAKGEDRDVLAMIKDKQTRLRDLIGSYVTDDDQAAYASVRDDLDLGVLLDMVEDVVSEVAGTVPTVRSASSDGSPPPGLRSMDGAVREGSIPSAPPSTDS